MKFDKFLDTYKVGKGYDYDGVYGCQCVDLAKFYIRDVLEAKPQSIGNAVDYWKKRNGKYIKSLFTVVPSGERAKRGDLFIRDSGKFGHIGIVTSADSKGFNTIEQNAGGSGVVSQMYHPYANDMHFLRPIIRKNISNSPDVKTGDRVTLTARCKCYKNTSKEVYMVNELSQFSVKEEARLKKGRSLKAVAVDHKGEDIWIKVSINEFPVYLYVYNSKKDKAYIK